MDGIENSDRCNADTNTVLEAEIPSAKERISASKRLTNSSEHSRDRKVKRLRRKTNQTNNSAFIKYGSLFLLVAQLVGLVMLMRYSRTHRNGADLYLSSTAVFCMEVMKFVACNGVVFVGGGFSASSWISELTTHVWNSPFEVIKISVPSFLYVIQNNLLYLALTNLDAATYQVCYQLKILTTALFSATMLNRTFSKTKWLALVILTIGVAVVQTSGDSASHSENSDQNRSLGLFAILCAACTSGFSGVYFEKMLKGSSTSLWMRNIQMGLPSMLLALMTVFIQDGRIIREKGFFVGYSTTVWTVVVVQAVGGLIVAVVVKYADNVLKTFASSFGIVISCLMSAILFGQKYNAAFLVGASLVVLSTVLYSKPEKRQRKRLKKTILPK
jgi:UDP-sugar transporter A1/2/3